MRRYTKLTEGRWKDKRAATFNVRACGVKMSKHTASRINNTLRKQSGPSLTLGDLVKKGPRNWVLMYNEFGTNSAVALAYCINAVAGEQVVEIPVVNKSGTTTKRKVIPALVEARMDPYAVTAGPTISPPVVLPSPSKSEVIERLGRKFKVTTRSDTVSSSETILVRPDDDLFENYSFGQLRAKAVAQQRQLHAINRENVELRRQLVELRARVMAVLGEA